MIVQLPQSRETNGQERQRRGIRVARDGWIRRGIRGIDVRIEAGMCRLAGKFLSRHLSRG